MPDSSPFGGQTVTGPGWPNVDEDALAAAAASYEALAAKLTGSVVPQQQGQLMQLSDSWKGAAALAATGEASMIIGGHETNAAQAAAIAAKLRSMEVTVAKTKALVNATALETQHECEAIQALPFSNTQELVQSRIKFGLSQNIAYVTANTTELASTLGVPPSIPQVSAPPTAAAQQAAGQNPQQAMQMLSQMGSMAAQLPQQLGGMLTQAPQQLTQPLQQLSQPLQQLTSMFGQAGKGRLGRDRNDGSFVVFQPPAGRRFRQGRRYRHGARGVAAWLRRRSGADTVDGELGREQRRGSRAVRGCRRE